MIITNKVLDSDNVGSDGLLLLKIDSGILKNPTSSRRDSGCISIDLSLVRWSLLSEIVHLPHLGLDLIFDVGHAASDSVRVGTDSLHVT